jgi:hypothetical protein
LSPYFTALSSVTATPPILLDPAALPGKRLPCWQINSMYTVFSQFSVAFWT